MRLRVPSPHVPASLLLLAALMVGHVGVAGAQTPFVPYFGKNNIHYDKFD